MIVDLLLVGVVVLVAVNVHHTFLVLRFMPEPNHDDELHRLRYEAARADAEMTRITKETIQTMLDEARGDEPPSGIARP